MTSVTQEIADLVRAAVRQLRGLRFCEDVREESRVTHLVIGAERRTIKARCVPALSMHALPGTVAYLDISAPPSSCRQLSSAMQVLLAIACGAFLMTPEWITASLAAGVWLPEHSYLSNVRSAPLPVSCHRCGKDMSRLKISSLTE